MNPSWLLTHQIIICIVLGKMFTVSTLGIETIDLENAIQSIRVVDNAQHGCHPFQVRKRGPDIIFSDLQNRKIYKYTIDSSTLDDFAGSGNENSVDGPLVQCSLRQSCEIDIEFDNVVYATDAMSGTVSIISPLTNTVKFLKAVGDLYRGFSVHDKGKPYETFNLQSALGRIHNSRVSLEENEQAIYHDVNTHLPKTLNGTQGNVAGKTIDSVRLVEWGVKPSKRGYKAIQTC